ncbi:hypothetical protein B0H14DRAFT_3617549 [Mycena olivaceomarginata]|nr:hypothetical protein B0H14DRAFT_3617549 [Mycena olivaceomarginata]
MIKLRGSRRRLGMFEDVKRDAARPWCIIKLRGTQRHRGIKISMPSSPIDPNGDPNFEVLRRAGHPPCHQYTVGAIGNRRRRRFPPRPTFPITSIKSPPPPAELTHFGPKNKASAPSSREIRTMAIMPSFLSLSTSASSSSTASGFGRYSGTCVQPTVKKVGKTETWSNRNADKLREAARMRMQQWVPQILVLYSPILVDQGIAAVASFNIFTQRKYARKVALASERYRDRKRDEEHAERRAADAVTRQARGIEKDALHRKHTKLKKVLPLLLIAIPPPHAAKPPHTISKPCAASPSSPTPALRHAPVIRMPAVTIANEDSSDAESREEGEHHPLEPSIWPARASRPQCCRYCYQEDCVGCACLWSYFGTYETVRRDRQRRVATNFLGRRATHQKLSVISATDPWWGVGRSLPPEGFNVRQFSICHMKTSSVVTVGGHHANDS